jgi:translocation and assembly module TamA
MPDSLKATVPGRMLRGLLVAVTCLLCTTLWADELEIAISGVDGLLLANAQARTQSFRVTGNNRLSRRRLEQQRVNAERRAAIALRPFGYYHPVIRSQVRSTGNRQWLIELHIDRGPPVLIESVRLDITGPGQGDATLQKWRKDWPLKEGSVLNQATWSEQKTNALALAEAHGYLNAGFTAETIELDLDRNRASLLLSLETGEQALMGQITFHQDAVRAGILELLPRFEEGQAYDAWLMEQFRLDLWRTGFFGNIEVLEDRQLDISPPRVDLVVNLETRTPNTWQGSLGYGTDSGFRVQAMWNRHLLSERGDRLDVGFGWQQKDNEFNFRTGYQHPRRVAGRQYWTAELLYKTEKQNFQIRPTGSGETYTVARGNVNDYSFRPGWLRVRHLRRGFQQIFEHWYAQYLIERSDFSLVDQPPPESGLVSGDIIAAQDAGQRSETTSLGVNWDWPVVRGNGFQTVGHSHRAWIFTSNEAWGSDLDFTQAYVAARWNSLLGDRWKLLLRGEIGYSSADVNERLVELDGQFIPLSVTDLPSAYRFKAGGSQSVRGYGFEDLSDNNIGSNNIVTASIEIEYLFRESWSLAAFFDAGNAFNDWSHSTLRKGVGVGIRWYSIAGPIRFDVAQALDEPGKPWRFHFTIGTPLL